MESFQALTPKDWFEFSFQVAGALGSVATLLAFLFLFRRDKDKQEQIDKLAKIAEATNRQADAMQAQLYQYRDGLRLQFLPSLKIARLEPTIVFDSFMVTICNYGKPCRIILEKSVNDSYTCEKNKDTPPYDLKAGDEQTYRFISANGFDATKSKVIFDIIYMDEMGFFYKSTLQGNKSGADMPYGRLLEPVELRGYNLTP